MPTALSTTTADENLLHAERSGTDLDQLSFHFLICLSAGEVAYLDVRTALGQSYLPNRDADDHAPTSRNDRSAPRLRSRTPVDRPLPHVRSHTFVPGIMSFITHTDSMSPFPPEALSRLVRFRFTTSPSPGRVAKQLSFRSRVKEPRVDRCTDRRHERQQSSHRKTGPQWRIGEAAHSRLHGKAPSIQP